MDRRWIYYLLGLGMGCLLLTIMPRPFTVDRTQVRAEAARHTGRWPYVFKDGYGREANLAYPPRRIVSLAPSITEMLYYLGAGDRLVANTPWCRFPARAMNLDKVNDMVNPDMELLISYKPDVIIGSLLSPRSLYSRLNSVNLTAVAFSHDGWDGINRDILTLGRILELQDTAREKVAQINSKKDAILEGISNTSGPPPSVLILYDIANLTSAGKGSWPDEIISTCGGVNVAANATSSWPQLSLEYIIEADPQVLLLSAPPSGADRTAFDNDVAALKEHPVWKNISAVKDGRMATIDQELLNIPGPRAIHALEAIARALYPQAFAAPARQAHAPTTQDSGSLHSGQ